MHVCNYICMYSMSLLLFPIQYLVERIQGNYALQVILNTFLANLGTSATFATILLNFLLKRMREMGCTLVLPTCSACIARTYVHTYLPSLVPRPSRLINLEEYVQYVIHEATTLCTVRTYVRTYIQFTDGGVH